MKIPQKHTFQQLWFVTTPPKFNSSPLKNDAWKMSFLLGASLFLGAMLNFWGVFQLRKGGVLLGFFFAVPKQINMATNSADRKLSL